MGEAGRHVLRLRSPPRSRWTLIYRMYELADWGPERESDRSAVRSPVGWEIGERLNRSFVLRTPYFVQKKQ